MKTLVEEVKIVTKARTSIIDVTCDIEKIVQKSNIKNGICLIQSLHTTTAVIVNEHEDGLMEDIINKAKKEFPSGIRWLHDRIDNNAHAHIASSFLGISKVLGVKEGGLLRGTWQNIFLLELDGPRNRTIAIIVLGE